jgi:hypothetical protein
MPLAIESEIKMGSPVTLQKSGSKATKVFVGQAHEKEEEKMTIWEQLSRRVRKWIETQKDSKNCLSTQ